MTTTRLPAACILACSLLIAGIAVAQNPVQMRYAMKKGETVQYVDLSEGLTTQEMGGQEMKIKTTTRSVARFVIDDVSADGSMTVISSVDTLLVSSSTPMRDTTMLMKEMMGKRKKMVLSPAGVISGRVVIDTAKLGGRMRMSMGAQDMVRIHQLPEKGVAPGATWTTNVADTAEAMGGKIVSSYAYAYTVAGMEMKNGVSCVKVTYKSDMTTEGKGSAMGSDVFIEGKGNGTGTYYFDAARGVTVADDGVMETDATIAFTGQQSMTMPMSQKVSFHRTLLTGK